MNRVFGDLHKEVILTAIYEPLSGGHVKYVYFTIATLLKKSCFVYVMHLPIVEVVTYTSTNDDLLDMSDISCSIKVRGVSNAK